MLWQKGEFFQIFKPLKVRLERALVLWGVTEERKSQEMSGWAVGGQ